MNKLFSLLVSLAFLVVGAAANAANCADAVAKVHPYKGAVAVVSNVSVKKAFAPDASILTEGVRYDFMYTYPNGKAYVTYTVVALDGKPKVTNGDKLIWIPANAAVRTAYPYENRHVPAIVTKTCQVFGIDFSRPAREIDGL